MKRVMVGALNWASEEDYEVEAILAERAFDAHFGMGSYLVSWVGYGPGDNS
jgi:hypothetical protein